MPGTWYGLRVFAMLVIVLSFGIMQANAQAGARQGTSRTKTQNHADEVANANSAEVAAAKADLEKMKVLLNQMQVNLGFVQTSQTPLKHQFELETEMWGVLIRQMERHVDAMEKQYPAASTR
jgi:hypothetical protein